MIAGTYIGSAVVLVVLTILFVGGSLGMWGFMALLLATFFLASAGASSAYLTVSEIFPMETRALAIAFFYAIGTAIGGITGPYLFGKMIESGEESQVAIAFFLGAAVMAIGGIAEIFFGVKAEQQELEDIAKPISAEDAERRPRRRRPDEEAAAAPSAQRRGRDLGAERSAAAPRAGAALPARPGRTSYSPGMAVSAPITEQELSREIGRIESALAEHGPTERRQLARAVGARYWGPGRFSAALREAVLAAASAGSTARTTGRRRAGVSPRARSVGRRSRMNIAPQNANTGTTPTRRRGSAQRASAPPSEPDRRRGHRVPVQHPAR